SWRKRKRVADILRNVEDVSDDCVLAVVLVEVVLIAFERFECEFLLGRDVLAGLIDDALGLALGHRGNIGQIVGRGRVERAVGIESSIMDRCGHALAHAIELRKSAGSSSVWFW